jgi:hypothetical protein
MANLLQGGFAPAGNQTRVQVRKYVIASGQTLNNSCVGFAVGDPVVRLANNTVTLLETGATTTPILGIIAAVTYRDTTGVRQYGGYIPAGTTYTGDADVINPFAAYVWVWDDPGTEFLAPMITASATTLTNFQTGFKNMDVTATSATSVDTVYKRSLRGLTGTAATTNTLPFRVLEIMRGPQQDYTANNVLVRCMMNAGAHPFFQATGL